MFQFLRKLFTGDREALAAPVGLPEIERESISHLLHVADGLPRVDWAAADGWIARQSPRHGGPEQWRRAVAAAWLDELRDSLAEDHHRWRSQNIEGLAPLAGRVAHAAAQTAERAYEVLSRDLAVIRGKVPIPPISLCVIAPLDSYITLISGYFPEEGEFATSGGIYLHEGSSAQGLVVVNAAGRHQCEQTIAHELTHHALRGSRLPIWVEEGFTQMMEERIVGVPNFNLDQEMMARQHAAWRERDIDEFLSGAGFHCPDDDVQELSYHLSQLVVRSELTRRPKEFFEFAKACRVMGAEEACVRHLGVTPRELVGGAIGLEEGE